jgi:hypothetical protein
MPTEPNELDVAATLAEGNGIEHDQPPIKINDELDLLCAYAHPVVAGLILSQQRAINLLESDITHLKSLIKNKKEKHATEKNNDQHR